MFSFIYICLDSHQKYVFLKAKVQYRRFKIENIHIFLAMVRHYELLRKPQKIRTY